MEKIIFCLSILMVKAGVIIAAIVVCILVVVGTVLGVWGSGVACPDFGMDCATNPAPSTGSPASTSTGTPAPSTGSPASTSTGTPAPSTGSPAGAPRAGVPSGSPSSLGSLGSTPDTPGNINGGSASTTDVNCQVSDWGPWGSCSKTCGGGTMKRTRTVTVQAAGNGTVCPPLEETDTCNNQECPVDCVESAWSSWGPCSAPCNGGTQTRTRTITTQPTFNGRACGPLSDSQECNTNPCPVDCVGSWVGCNVPCGSGTDMYKITTPAANGGKACDTADGSTKSCVMPPCGVDCVGGWEGATVSNPDGWSVCTAACGTGEQTRTYKVTTPSAGSGKSCPYGDGYKETRNCPGLSPCPQPVNCEGSWSNWTGCSKGCGGGTRTKRYTITKDAANGGTACPNRTGDVETENCNTTSCCDPSQYRLSEWADVTGADGKAAPPFNCDGTAGDGRPYVLQSRSVSFPTNPNGPANKDDCNIQGLNRYRYTAIGCSDRRPTGGSCSDSAVSWSATNGCTVTPATKDPTGGTCNPTGNPWSLAGCTPSASEVTPSGGTCSISGISWNATDGCKVSPATRTGTVQCSAGSWNGSSCQIWPGTTNPSGGTCSQPHATWTTGGCTNGPQVDGIEPFTCQNGSRISGYYQWSVKSDGCYKQWRSCGKSGCTLSSATKDNSTLTDWTCPSGYTKSATQGKCDPIPATVTAVSGCPPNYSGDASRNTCVAGSGTVTGIDCSQFAGYEADITNKNCKARSVTTTDLTCPAGYSKDLTNNKCKVVTGTVASVTGCPVDYNSSASSNKCTAKAATISSLTCANPEYFRAGTSSNKCVPYA